MKYNTPLITAALLALLFTGCSKHSPSAATDPKLIDLGVVEISDGTQIRRDLGGGKACIITPTVTVATNKTAQGGGVTLIKMRMTIEQPDSSGTVHKLECPSVLAKAGQPAMWGLGDMDISLTTSIKP